MPFSAENGVLRENRGLLPAIFCVRNTRIPQTHASGYKSLRTNKMALWAGAIFSKRLKRSFRPPCVCGRQTGRVIVFGGERQYREEKLFHHYGRQSLLQVFITPLKKRNAVTACVKKHRRRKQYSDTRRIHRCFFDTRTFCSPPSELRFLREYPQPRGLWIFSCVRQLRCVFQTSFSAVRPFLECLTRWLIKKMPFPRFCYFFANATSITSSARFTGIN